MIQTGLLQGLGEQRVERLDVRPGGDLGHHAAEPLVQVLLARDQVRPNGEAVLDDRDRGLVAGGLDPQGDHRARGRIPSGSLLDDRAIRRRKARVADVVGPHDQRVLVQLRVVVPADARPGGTRTARRPAGPASS